ncbi:MAG: biopolymer transporter TolR [Phycisphaerae bacterium SG8_4]|nr:MAG: biopolymer transporter TolR [Phycisphaerae bacterium SG8_4]
MQSKNNIALLLMILVCVDQTFAKDSNLGGFDAHNDVGRVQRPGSVRYDTESEQYLIEGSGTNMWFGQDEFHFLWKRLKGDFILRARVKFVGQGVEPHRKTGWMIRETLDHNSAHVNACVHGDGLTSLQFRRTKDGPTEEVKSTATAPDVIQLERRGGTCIMSTATFGETFAPVQMSDLQLKDEVYVGLYVCSHNPEVSETVSFINVRITVPATDDFRPYRDYIGSRLEIMDIEDGHRKVVYDSSRSIQAPNWTLDGKSLIYNSEGLLYRFDLAAKTPTVVYTDFANRNNNDHVLSFDGRYLGICHHSSEDDDNSIIYTLPVGGGRPQRVTKLGPSYLHGWSPDGKELIYTGLRSGQYDIYRISRFDRKEIQLTDTKALDDGPEYTPDGKFIYFNSNRTGTMQIWRMNSDGTKPQQITFDQYNDWFPHISPDGRWIVFLSFAKEIDSADHPFYKQVYLRLMPTAGGRPKVIGYVYGGQGTINVPSWCPDSKRIAFVSNTGFD